MDTAAIVAAAIGLLGALVIPLRRLRKRDSSSTPKSDGSGDNAGSDERQKYRTAYVAALHAGLKNIRDDLASYGTAIGVASTGLIAAATLTAAKDLFPAPTPQSTVLIALVLLLGFISIVASAWLTALFFRARRHVLLDTDVLAKYWDSLKNVAQTPKPSRLLRRRMVLYNKLNTTEIKMLLEKLQGAAEVQGYANLPQMEAECRKLSREAARIKYDDTDDQQLAVAVRKEKEAIRLDEKIGEALLESVVLIVERRASKVYRGVGTVILAAVAAFAVFTIFFSAAWSQGQQERITSYVACVKDIGATAPGTCQRLYSQPTGTSSASGTPTDTPAAIGSPAPGTTTASPR